jgi:hypothetical protein
MSKSFVLSTFTATTSLSRRVRLTTATNIEIYLYDTYGATEYLSYEVVEFY